MSDAIYYEQNFPIGSGVIEAICNTLVTQWLNSSEVLWNCHGGQAILTIPVLNHSQLFDHALGVIGAKYQHIVSAANGYYTGPLFKVV